MNTYDIIINRMLANYIKRQIDTMDLGSQNDFECVCGILGLPDVDANNLLSAMKKKLKRLEKSSIPLSEYPRDWRNDIIKNNERR